MLFFKGQSFLILSNCLRPSCHRAFPQPKTLSRSNSKIKPDRSELRLGAPLGAKRAPQRSPEVLQASILNDLARFSNDFWKDLWAVERHGGGKAVGNWITETKVAARQHSRQCVKTETSPPALWQVALSAISEVLKYLSRPFPFSFGIQHWPCAFLTIPR